MSALLKAKHHHLDLLSTIVLIVSFLCLPAGVLAAPAVSGVGGTVANGETITITGSGFGSTGPVVVIFDDFEKGTNGNIISTSANSATVGRWTATEAQPDHPVYSTDYARSGTKSMLADQASYDGAHWAEVSFSTTTQIFLSHWVYLPTNMVVPGAGGSYGANWKLAAIMANVGGSLTNMYTTCVTLSDLPPSSGAFQGPGAWYGSEGLNECGYVNTGWKKGAWHRFDNYYVGSKTNQGVIRFWDMGGDTKRTLRCEVLNGKTLQSNIDGWNLMHMHAYARQSNNSKCYYDDVYLATGSAAQARVEICNNSNYSQATNCSISNPTQWGNTSVTATVRQGALTAGSLAYLYVIDSTGAASPSYPVTIGSGGPAPAPAIVSPPTGLHVITN